MATWNVRTTLQAGKVQEISNEITSYRIDITVYRKKKRKTSSEKDGWMKR
jgi:hypothetical protein